MDALIQAQYEMHARIGRTWENLKKAGAAKITLGLVQATMVQLDKKWSLVEKHHATLLSKYWNELKTNDYYTKDFILTAEVTFLAQRGNLLDHERSLQPKVEESPRERTETGPARSSLPRIQLPEFSGEFEQWPEFRYLFLSIINRDSTLSGVEKLHYLKTSVKGSAANLLRNLSITGENFDRAWSMLSGHFENKRLLTQSYLSRFTAIPKMKGETVGELGKIYHGMLSTVAALEGIKRPITNCSDLFIHFIVERMSTRSRSEWEDAIGGSTDPPSLAQLSKFMEHRMHTLEAMSKTSSTAKNESAVRAARSHLVKKQNVKTKRCACCTKDHYVLFCEKYKQKEPKKRMEMVEKNGLCLNFLGRHPVSECLSQKTCTKCSARHHTTLHDASANASSLTATAESSTTSHVSHRGNNAVVLLATARVMVLDKFGVSHRARALIDPGSETSLASESLAQRLYLPRKSAAVTIFGVGGHKTATSNGRVQLIINSRVGLASFSVSALVLPRLTAYDGKIDTDRKSWPHLRELELADPDFLSQDPIDLLLGADVHATILQDGLKKSSPRSPIAQRTALGWIISGLVGESGKKTKISSNQCSVGEELSALVRKFWEQEEFPATLPIMSAAEKKCEKLYATTHSRNSDGRYVVRLPLASALPDLSDTRRAAVRLLHAMERRFKSDAPFRSLYFDFISEYETLNHMSESQPLTLEQQQRACFLPHHGVMRASSQTTKLRVVFNGSQQTLSGESLNKCLLVGPNLLPALTDVILRWRCHKYVLISDIEKMYRQIEVDPDDRILQQILWRNNDEITEYQLNTVTYGFACAPFLAIRILQQLANDEENRFSVGAAALRRDVYVDDVLTGAHSIDDARCLQDQLLQLCKAGGFPLRKWASNAPSLISDLPPNLCSQQGRSWQSGETYSALGLHWDLRADCFEFIAQPRKVSSVITKRSLLSKTAQLFDPLGWLAPIVVRAKLLIQSTWLQRIDWDTPLRDDEAGAWTQLREELPCIESICVPRWILSDIPDSSLELHGFADASEKAYAAETYLRTETAERQVVTSLLLAKTKVAPLKKISLPRLELCAASLLTKLISHVTKTLKLESIKTYLWSDSTVALGWIRGHPARWSTFVANRVAEI